MENRISRPSDLPRNNRTELDIEIEKRDSDNLFRKHGFLSYLCMISLRYCIETIEFYRERPNILYKELVSGLTISILQVPESVAFSFVAGVEPVSGLYATAILGFITGAVGGRPAQVSGAAGALAVVMADLTDCEGPLKELSLSDRRSHLFMAVIFTGAFQIIAGMLVAARLVRLIPESAMIGFLNGLAIIIFRAQLSAFRVVEATSECSTDVTWMALDQGQTWMVLLIVAVTMLIMVLWKRVPKLGQAIPASLIALIFGVVFEVGFNRPFFGYSVPSVKDNAGNDGISGGLPDFGIPDLGESPKWGTILQYAASLAAIGLIESVMTLQAVDEITDTPPSLLRSNQECIAQGIGNFLCGFCRAMGGDAMIGQSTVNVLQGARYRVSAASAGVFMLIIILVAGPVIELVPIASLTGVLFFIVLNTFSLDTFKLLSRVHYQDAIGIILVTVLAVVTDLSIAVAAGVVWSALINAWNSGYLMKASTIHMDDEDHTKVYIIRGPLFFGSIRAFGELFDPSRDPDHIIIDFSDSLISDFSAVSAIRGIAKRYKLADKRVSLRGVSHGSHHLHRVGTWIEGVRYHGSIEKDDERAPLVVGDLRMFQVKAEDEVGDPIDALEHLVDDELVDLVEEPSSSFK